MKIRLFVHLIPLQQEKVPPSAIPPHMQNVAKQMVAFRPGTPMTRSKIIEFPDDIPIKLHGGLIIQVTENHHMQASMVKWDRLETEGPKIKVIFTGNIDMQNLASLLQEMKEAGGWEEGCSCRTCRGRDGFAEMMRRMMNNDPEKN